MMIIMKANATPQQVEAVIASVKSEGLNVHLSQGVEATIIGAIGETHSIPLERFEVWMAWILSSVLHSRTNLHRVNFTLRIPFSASTDSPSVGRDRRHCGTLFGGKSLPDYGNSPWL